MVGFLHGIGVTNILFNLVATPDGKNPSMNIAEVYLIYIIYIYLL